MRHVAWFLVLSLATLATGVASAQPQVAPSARAQSPAAPLPAQAAAPPEWSPRTGDAWVDAVLADINAYGRRYPDAFADELARYRGAPRDVVVALLADPAWTPGDVYFACALAQAIGRSCRYVADEWQAHAGEGWGALAQQLDIKPGSPQFHALKDGFADAYRRWGRPLPPASAGKARDGKARHGKAKGRDPGARKPAGRAK
jgi:hypothetical protein